MAHDIVSLSDLPQPLTPPSRRRQQLLIIAPALLVLAAVAALALASIQLLSGVRAFATAESFFSKARVEAVEQLRRHVQTGDPSAFERYRQALRVPLGDVVTRQAIDQPEPDMARARRGMVDGGNDPADAATMVLLYRYMRNAPLFRPLRDDWYQVDRLVGELQAVAAQLQPHAGDPAAAAPALQRLEQVSAELAAIERHVATSFTHSAHVLERVLMSSLLTISIVFGALSCWFVRRSLLRAAAREKALAAANHRWALAAEAAGLGLFDWLVQRDELRLDARAAALYGLAKGHGVVVPRAVVTGLIDPTDALASGRQVEKAMDSGALYKARYRIRRPDGSLRHVESTGRPHETDLADGGRMVGVVRDVTDEERQAQIAHERDAATSAARARTEFMSRLSHELRTPLNAVLGFAQLLEIDDQPELSRLQAERVRHILASGAQLLKLVEDVLDINKIDVGAVSVQLSRVDVIAALHTSLAMVHGVARAHGVEIDGPGRDEPLWAVADGQRLQQVFVNLLTNACKYNRRGGRVRLQAWAEGGRVKASVADTGIGISEAEQALLFQPFRRLATPAAQVEGTGLGLFIVKSLVEHMHGRVVLDSRVGEGSCFTIDLPAAS